MAQRLDIKCINKTDRYSAHERIRNIGGTNGDGSRWKMSVAAAITAIEKLGSYRSGRTCKAVLIAVL